MLPKINLKSLQLGSDSAEKDIEVGLLRYFVKSPSYLNVLHGKKTIVVGNRGVGKSAIFKYMASEQRKAGNIVIELSPEEYSYEILSTILKKESEGNWGKQSSYSISWQYLLYNLILKELAKGLSNKFCNGPEKAIYIYARDNLKLNDLNPIGILVSYLKRIESFKIGSYEAGFKVKELQSLYNLETINDLIPSIKDMLQDRKIFIFVDELDKGWDNSEDARLFIAGLIQASQKINLVSPNLKQYVSIRQELFENIPQIYDDAQKIREDIEIIQWTEEELLEFIGLRLSDAIPELDGMEKIDKWNVVFENVLDYRGVKSFNYLIDRTQLRPREFLQFCKACIETVSASSEKINYNDIVKAEADYSEQKTKDLASEYRFQYPDLLNIFELFRGKKYNFESEELEYFLLEICEGTLNVGKAIWVKGFDYRELKKILWQIGFIKAYIIGGLKTGRKSGSSYCGFYEISRINLENITRFQVHPAFRAYLNMKEK